MPAAVIASDKKEDKKEEKHEEEKSGATTPTDKKAKRNSVFGSLFQKKNVTSPTTERTEAETANSTSEVPPVSETAPKIDEPIDTKPIDAAAVTAPANTEAITEDATKDNTTTSPAAETPKTEKKGGFLSGFIKKVEGKKEEPKEEKPTETTTATAEPSTTPAHDGATETPSETPVTKEERPARERRRTSLFGSLGTMKKKSETKDDTTKTTEPAVNGTETKREKSPLPTKIGGLFRKPSKAVKSDAPKETATEPTAEPTTDATTAIAEPTPATETTALPEAPESKIIGDVVPEAVHAQTAPEVKASA